MAQTAAIFPELRFLTEPVQNLEGWLGKRPQPMCRAALPAWRRLPSSMRPVPFAKPGAVCCHLRALRRGRMPLASRSLVALFPRSPPQLDAVVRVVAHFEIPSALEHDFQRERPRRAVAARIRKLALREVRCEDALQLGLYVRYGLPIRY